MCMNTPFGARLISCVDCGQWPSGSLQGCLCIPARTHCCSPWKHLITWHMSTSRQMLQSAVNWRHELVIKTPTLNKHLAGRTVSHYSGWWTCQWSMYQQLWPLIPKSVFHHVKGVGRVCVARVDWPLPWFMAKKSGNGVRRLRVCQNPLNAPHSRIAQSFILWQFELLKALFVF